MRNVDVAIVGAGHAGLNALKEIKKHTDNWVLINGGELGTTCARVGCMPSKAIIELTNRNRQTGVLDERIPDILERTRDLRDLFVDLILANSTDNMTEGQQLISGYPTFVGPDRLRIGDLTIQAKTIVVATGSSPVVPEEWKTLGDRILTTESLFDLETLPASIGMIGLGYVGLEMAQAFHRLGRRVVGFNTGGEVGGIVDPVISAEAEKIFSREFPIHIGHAAKLFAEPDGVTVKAGDVTEKVDKVFVAVGRKPNIPAGLESFVAFDAHGVPHFDPETLQVGDLPVFLAGDANGTRMLLQDAAEEGKLAGRNAVSSKITKGDKRTFMSIGFTDPNICTVGAKFDAIDTPIVGEQRFGPNGRALAMGSNRGLIRIYADTRTERVLGASMVGPRVEHLAHLVAWAIQMDLTITGMSKMPFYHPVVEEALQEALHDTSKKFQRAAIEAEKRIGRVAS